METGPAKFPRYTAGLMIMEKMGENLFLKRNPLEKMKVTIKLKERL